MVNRLTIIVKGFECHKLVRSNRKARFIYMNRALGLLQTTTNNE